ncbi:MAG: hypothetical protein ACK50Q_12830 [Labrys sp. (in: a-proteobacteria)]
MRRFLRFLVGLCVILAMIPLGLGLVLLDDKPNVEAMLPPKPEDVRFTRAFVQKVRQATDATEPGADVISLPVDELRGMMRLGTRFLPSLRADAIIEGDVVSGSASLPVPWLTGTKWLNVRASVPAFEGRVSLRSAAIGPFDLPPDLALAAGQFAANLILGNNAGDTILRSATSLRIDNQTMIFTLRLNKDGRGNVIQSVFRSLRDGEMPSTSEIDAYYVKLRTAMDNGELPTEGSYLPYIIFTLKAAMEETSPEKLPNAYTAAFFALTKTCGAKDFTLIVGRLAGDALNTFGEWKTNCDAMTLAGRIDTRRHFTTAATIKAASNRGVAISVGEFKELYDSISGAGGFDFTDIVANNSGIRMSDLFMFQPRSVWPNLIEKMKAESDFLGSFEGVPGIMTEDVFKERFGDVNSPAYREMLARIEANIDRTTLHATPPTP